MSGDARARPDRPVVAVGVIVVKDDRVLLIQRAKPPRAGEWSIPGGGQKLGETVREAALREVREETALDVHLLDVVEVVDAIFDGPDGQPEYHYTLIDFAALWVDGVPRAGDDAGAVQWIALEDLDAFPLWQKTRDVIRKAAEMARKSSPNP